MSELQSLNYEEKLLLAGSIKMILFADGALEDIELNDLGNICRRLQFDDFEKCLEEFEKTVKDQESYFSLAKNTRNPKTQDIILRLLDELILHSGNPDKIQRSVFERLRKLWE